MAHPQCYPYVFRPSDGRHGSSSSQRPQDRYNIQVDNSHNPFKPIITYKPNAIVPIERSLKRQGRNSFAHPYAVEIESYEIDPMLLIPCDPQEPPKLDDTPLTLVEDLQQLKHVCKVIESEREIAVDLEHNSYRSFQGITCLLQISTRNHDYVIDAIKLRKELHLLNHSFTNPAIVKVFHGADNDILWLQRDFGVYVVNLFDTSRAAKVMKFAQLSLAFLMEHYCNIEAQKYYQLADWRERPLPQGMLNYARSDTHYLLYIYDKLRNEIFASIPGDSNGKDRLKSVFNKGRAICLKRYEKPPFSETGYMSVIKKWRYPGKFTQKQVSALQLLYRWRDDTGRRIDESPGYVLSNYHMMRIAQHLPVQPQSLLALCAPEPPLMKTFVNEILDIIHDVRNLHSNEDNLDPDSIYPASGYNIQALDLDERVIRQDTAHSQEMQNLESMPVLLDKLQSATLSQSGPSEDRTMHKHPPSDAVKDSRSSYYHETEGGSRLFKFMLASGVNQQSNDGCRAHSDKTKSNMDPSLSGRNAPNRQRKQSAHAEYNRSGDSLRSTEGVVNQNNNLNISQPDRRPSSQHHQHHHGTASYRHRQDHVVYPSVRDHVEKSLQSTCISPYQRYISTKHHQQK